MVTVHCRAFSSKEANDARLPVEQLRKPNSEGFYYRIGDRRFEDGYLFKSYNVRNLSLEEGVPPLEELQRFNQVSRPVQHLFLRRSEMTVIQYKSAPAPLA